jgi:GNAT superfamily N-acetyltransferase
VAVDLVRPLRQVVLRPGHPAQESVYPGDDDRRAVHAGARLGPGGEIVAVGSLLPEDPPWPVPEELSGRCFRIRGMATREGLRDRGFGTVVLDELLRRSEMGGGLLVWCNARQPAVPFYTQAGFAPVGAPFELPDIGSHQAMQRPVSPARPGTRSPGSE